MRVIAVVLAVASATTGCGIATGPERDGPLAEGAPIVPVGSVEAKVFFVSGGRMYETLRTLSGGPGLAAAAIDAILAGPNATEQERDRAVSPVAGLQPATTAAVVDGTAIVDLAGDFSFSALPPAQAEEGMRLAVEQIVRTLTGLPGAGIGAVRLKINGVPQVGRLGEELTVTSIDTASDLAAARRDSVTTTCLPRRAFRPGRLVLSDARVEPGAVVFAGATPKRQTLTFELRQNDVIVGTDQTPRRQNGAACERFRVTMPIPYGVSGSAEVSMYTPGATRTRQALPVEIPPPA